MRRLKSLSVVLALSLLIITGCKKDDESENGGVYLSMKVNGNLKEAKGDTQVFANFIQSAKNLQVIGNMGDNIAFSFQIANPAVGDFDVASDQVLFLMSDVNNASDAYFGDTGTITITSFSNSSVKGTFHAEASNGNGEAVHITEGKFEAKVIVQ